MGLESSTFDDSSYKLREKSDVVSESSQLEPKKSSSLENILSSSNIHIEVDLLSPKFTLVEKRWIKCLEYSYTDVKDSVNTLNKTFHYLNNAVRSTLNRLNNYESLLMFSHLVYKKRNNDEFLNSLESVLVQWYFCLKYNFRLSEFPFLGSRSTFNNLVWGLQSVEASLSHFLFKLYDDHSVIKGMIQPIMGSRSQGEDSCNSEVSWEKLIENFSTFSNFESSLETKEFCQDFMEHFLNLNLSLSEEGIPFICEESDSVLDELWRRIIQFSPETGCSCQNRVYLMLVETYTKICLKGRNKEVVSDSVNRLIGLYCKWLLIITGSKNVEESLLKRGCQFVENKEGENVLEKIEYLIKMVEFSLSVDDKFKSSYAKFGNCLEFDLKDQVIHLFSRFLRRCIDIYESYTKLPKELLSIAYSFMSLELDKQYRSGRGELLLEGKRGWESLTDSLYGSLEGRRMLSRFYTNINYFEFEFLDVSSYLNLGTRSSLDVVCDYAQGVYGSIAKLGGVKMESVNFRVYFANPFTCPQESSNSTRCVLKMPENDARQFLEELCNCLEKKRTSVCNMSVYSEVVARNKQLGSEEIKWMRRNSPLCSTVIALASLMDDRVCVDFKTSDCAVVSVKFRSIYRTSSDLLPLVFRLIYSEISDDFVMTLEHRNPELSSYRVLLLKYLFQLTQSPINSKNKVKFTSTHSVDFKGFIRRLFKLVNFKTNQVLMDRVVFDKYLTTRVVQRTKRSESRKRNLGKNDKYNEYNHHCDNDYDIDLHNDCYGDDSVNFVNYLNQHDDYGYDYRDEEKQEYDWDGLKHDKWKRKKRKDRNGFEEEEEEDENLDKESNYKSSGDILDSFGFLEYHSRRLNTECFKVNVKTEECRSQEGHQFVQSECFFKVMFQLLEALRYFRCSKESFGSEVLDKFTFKYYRRLCSNYFYDHYNTGLIYSRIIRVVSTNEYGEKTDNKEFVKYFGSSDEPNSFMQSLGLLDNSVGGDKTGDLRGSGKFKNGQEGRKVVDVPMINLLKLNNRFTKRTFYRLANEFCNYFFKFIPLSGIPTLLCSWASCLPTDSTSAVRSEKISTPRILVFMLITRICGIETNMGAKMFSSLDPLVSAINVIFVNLDIIYREPSAHEMCEVISSEDEFRSPQGIEILSQELELSQNVEVSDSEFYDKLVSSYNTIKAENTRRLKERRENNKRRNREEVKLLLKVSCLFSEVMDNITNKLYKMLINPDNLFVTKTDNSFLVTCFGKRRARFYRTLELLSLTDNTLSTTIRTCVLSTLNATDEPDLTNVEVKVNGSPFQKDMVKSEPKYETPARTVYRSYNSSSFPPSDRNSHVDSTPKRAPTRMLENSEFSELISKIRTNKEHIRSRLKYLSTLPFTEDALASSARETPSKEFADFEESLVRGCGYLTPGSLEDDLEGFIDFETDQHLAMLTYDSRNSSQKTRRVNNLNAVKRLKMSNMRKEWKCIIKSHLKT